MDLSTFTLKLKRFKHWVFTVIFISYFQRKSYKFHIKFLFLRKHFTFALNLFFHFILCRKESQDASNSGSNKWDHAKADHQDLSQFLFLFFHISGFVKKNNFSIFLYFHQNQDLSQFLFPYFYTSIRIKICHNLYFYFSIFLYSHQNHHLSQFLFPFFHISTFPSKSRFVTIFFSIFLHTFPSKSIHQFSFPYFTFLPVGRCMFLSQGGSRLSDRGVTDHPVYAKLSSEEPKVEKFKLSSWFIFMWLLRYFLYFDRICLSFEWDYFLSPFYVEIFAALFCGNICLSFLWEYLLLFFVGIFASLFVWEYLVGEWMVSCQLECSDTFSRWAVSLLCF